MLRWLFLLLWMTLILQLTHQLQSHVTSRNKKGHNMPLKLSHKDSNLNKQDQNLLCYHYTMRQYSVNLGGLEPPTPTLSR